MRVEIPAVEVPDIGSRRAWSRPACGLAPGQVQVVLATEKNNTKAGLMCRITQVRYNTPDVVCPCRRRRPAAICRSPPPSSGTDSTGSATPFEAASPTCWPLSKLSPLMLVLGPSSSAQPDARNGRLSRCEKMQADKGLVEGGLKCEHAGAATSGRPANCTPGLQKALLCSTSAPCCGSAGGPTGGARSYMGRKLAL